MAIADALREWVPRWWRGEGGKAGLAADLALLPAEALFRGAARIRNRAYDAGVLRAERAPIPVISIGNLGVGGAGKTPIAAWIASRLLEWGGRPAIVVRGYGRDEILVHRELNPGVPVIAAARRIEGVRRAAAEGRDVAVLDDAFQHRALIRELDIVLLSADGWTGTVRLLPRGPWREGLTALRRAHLVVVTRKQAEEATAVALERLLAGGIGGQQVVRARLESGRVRGLWGGGAGEGDALERLAGTEVLAVASLADPRPFHATLEAAGLIVERADFPDHHEFSAAEGMALVDRARGRPLVMTRKEGVKLRDLLPSTTEAWMLEQQVVIESGETMLENALRRAMRR